MTKRSDERTRSADTIKACPLSLFRHVLSLYRMCAHLDNMPQCVAGRVAQLQCKLPCIKNDIEDEKVALDRGGGSG